MIDVMIEEVQDLHVKVHGDDITVDEMKRKYGCEINTISITQLRNYLADIHKQMMFGKFGMMNENDL